MDSVNVKELRKLLGLTQQELAEKMDVAIFTIRRWEKGEARIHRVNQKRLERLAKRMERLKKRLK